MLLVAGLVIDRKRWPGESFLLTAHIGGGERRGAGRLWGDQAFLTAASGRPRHPPAQLLSSGESHGKGEGWVRPAFSFSAQSEGGGVRGLPQ